MANLYELNRAIEEFELHVDDITGEVTNIDELDALELERDTKMESIALWIKNLKADALAYRMEKEAFAEKERIAKNKMERLKAYLADALHGEKFSTSKVQVSYRKSQAVQITDLSILPDAMFRVPEPEPNKKAIGELLKAGAAVAGATLVEKNNIVIK